MSYSSKHGITQIRRCRRDNLSINRDFHFNPKKTFPVLLFTPDMENVDEHFHIELNRSQAKALRDWLSAWLRAQPRRKR